MRLLSGQIHRGGDQLLHLCHTSCAFLDAGLVVDWLGALKTWLDANPTDVVTILLVNSDNANATELAAIWQSAGVDKYSYAPADVTTAQAEWPTLASMVSSGKRLVTFLASIDATSTTPAGAPYLLDEFTFVFENPYDNTSPADFSCDPDRPSQLAHNTPAALASHRLPLMNHFLYDTAASIEFPAIEKVNVTNADAGPGSLGAAANNCTAVYNNPPNFFLVDYVNVGPAVDTADRLNGVQGNTQGRVPLPNTTLGSAPPSSTAAAAASATHTTDAAAGLPSISGTSGSSSFSGSSGAVATPSTTARAAATSGTSAAENAKRTGCAGLWVGACVVAGILGV